MSKIKLEMSEDENGNITQTIIFTLDDWEKKVLDHVVISATDWISIGAQNLMQNKIASGVQQMKSERPDLITEHDEDFVNAYTSQPDYKNRAARQAEENAAFEAQRLAEIAAQEERARQLEQQRQAELDAAVAAAVAAALAAQGGGQ